MMKGDHGKTDRLPNNHDIHWSALNHASRTRTPLCVWCDISMYVCVCVRTCACVCACALTWSSNSGSNHLYNQQVHAGRRVASPKCLLCSVDY